MVAFAGDKDSVSFPLHILDAPDAAITHGHPKSAAGFGGTLSFADMANMPDSKWAELRAVASGQGEWHYIIRRTGTANSSGFRAKLSQDIPMLEKRMQAAWDKAYTTACAPGKNRKAAIHRV